LPFFWYNFKKDSREAYSLSELCPKLSLFIREYFKMDHRAQGTAVLSDRLAPAEK